jgi:hypothetical protein
MAGNEYDALIESSQTGQPGAALPAPALNATPAPAANEYEAMLQQDSAVQKQTIQGNMFAASQRQPEQVAKAAQLAQRLKLPTALVEKNYDALAQHDAQQSQDYDSIIENTPGLAKFLEHPDNAALAKDDMDALSRVDQASRIVAPKPSRGIVDGLGDLKDATHTGFSGLHASIYHLAAAYGLSDIESAAEHVAAANKQQQELRARMPDYAKDFNASMEKEGGDVDRAWQRFTGSLGKLKEGDILGALVDFHAGRVQTIGQVLDLVGAAVSRPKGLLFSTAENAANAVPSLALGAAGSVAGFQAGSALGAAATIPLGPGLAVGAAAGGALGGGAGFIGGSFLGGAATEIGSQINEQLQKRGVDLTDPAAIAKAYRDPKFLTEVRAAAARKGVTTAAVDTLFSGFAGKLVHEAGGAGLAAKALAGAKEAGIGAVSEAGSEFAGAGRAREGRPHEGLRSRRHPRGHPLARPLVRRDHR